jgi:hypothetical protein
VGAVVGKVGIPGGNEPIAAEEINLAIGVEEVLRFFGSGHR